MKLIRVCLTAVFISLLSIGVACGFSFSDSTGKKIYISTVPQRVVSVVPSITEALFVMGAGDLVVGVTRHDTWPAEALSKPVVGGFFKPSAQKILSLNPDVVIVSGIQKQLIKDLLGKVILVQLDPESVEGSFKQILLIGEMMGHLKGAEKIISDNRKILNDIRRKVVKIPISKRKRVLRLMGRSKIMTPGYDSFQQDLIRLAGGITHNIKRNGGVIDLTDEEFLSFNPDVIYGCGEDRKVAEIIKGNSALAMVSAVKDSHMDWYPCELTCRASTNTGYFVSWLASNIYSEAFSVEEDMIYENNASYDDDLEIPISYVQNAAIARGSLFDFTSKTLVVDFSTPKTILSTLDGWQEKISTIGNHYLPPQCWRLMHEGGFDQMKLAIFKLVERDEDKSRFLYTGADMDKLSIKTVSFKDMSITVLATAGVSSNAVRMGKDPGGFYEPGTINILILPNMHLSPRAMSRAIISATEAKTAALQDLDVRSSYTPLVNPATGTGTDNIIVVEGAGTHLENAGGHSKLGELIARAVYGAVSESIFKQNGLTSRRTVFKRLKERKISIASIIGASACPCLEEKEGIVLEVENLLLDPRNSSLIEAAFAISDDYERNLVSDLSGFKIWCDERAMAIAGGEVPDENFILDETIPKPLAMAINALLVGVKFKIHIIII